MSHLYCYFSSLDDDAAALARELPGGPEVGGFDTVETKGIDPMVQMGTLEEILFGPSRVADGTMNLIGALRRSLATTGYTDLKEFQRVEVVVAPYQRS